MRRIRWIVAGECPARTADLQRAALRSCCELTAGPLRAAARLRLTKTRCRCLSWWVTKAAKTVRSSCGVLRKKTPRRVGVSLAAGRRAVAYGRTEPGS